MNNWEKDLSISSYRFENIVKPELKKILKGDLLLVEGESSDEMKSILDKLAGIDSWHINKLKGIRGIGSRIQTIKLSKFKNAKPFNTFTIRKKRDSGSITEFEKRKHAIKKDYLYPFYTIQAYVSDIDDSLLSCAIAKTKDIFEYIEKYNPSKNHTGKEQKGQSEFIIVDWLDFKKAGYRICIIN